MSLIKFSVLKNIATSVFLLLLSSAAFGVEREYVIGHEALDIFGAEALAFTPMWVKVWLIFLLGTFVAGIFFVRQHHLARWVVGGFVISMTTGHSIYSALDLPFLGGGIAIMHLVCWSPALILLLLKRPYFDVNESTGFRIWAGLITGFIIFSFIFDIRDAAIYINHINGLD
ncbi:hypothetical protein ACXJY6_06270 [Vibrio sp. RC27]